MSVCVLWRVKAAKERKKVLVGECWQRRHGVGGGCQFIHCWMMKREREGERETDRQRERKKKRARKLNQLRKQQKPTMEMMVVLGSTIYESAFCRFFQPILRLTVEFTLSWPLFAFEATAKLTLSKLVWSINAYMLTFQHKHIHVYMSVKTIVYVCIINGKSRLLILCVHVYVHLFIIFGSPLLCLRWQLAFYTFEIYWIFKQLKWIKLKWQASKQTDTRTLSNSEHEQN